MSVSKIRNSIKSAGFSGIANDWHIYKHEFYGIQLLEACENFQYNEIDPDQMDLIGKLYCMTIDEDN